MFFDIFREMWTSLLLMQAVMAELDADSERKQESYCHEHKLMKSLFLLLSHHRVHVRRTVKWKKSKMRIAPLLFSKV